MSDGYGMFDTSSYINNSGAIAALSIFYLVLEMIFSCVISDSTPLCRSVCLPVGPVITCSASLSFLSSCPNARVTSITAPPTRTRLDLAIQKHVNMLKIFKFIPLNNRMKLKVRSKNLLHTRLGAAT